jgi:hypothetical protein
LTLALNREMCPVYARDSVAFLFNIIACSDFKEGMGFVWNYNLLL